VEKAIQILSFPAGRKVSFVALSHSAFRWQEQWQIALSSPVRLGGGLECSLIFGWCG
jgi:hypothetical protein